MKYQRADQVKEVLSQLLNFRKLEIAVVQDRDYEDDKWVDKDTYHVLIKAHSISYHDSKALSKVLKPGELWHVFPDRDYKMDLHIFS